MTPAGKLTINIYDERLPRKCFDARIVSAGRVQENRMSVKRISALKKLIKDQNLDAMIVSRNAHVRYLTGYTGSNGLLVVEHNRAHFFTDSRYDTQARKQVKGAKVTILSSSLAVGMQTIPGLKKQFATVGYERDFATVNELEEFRRNLNGSLLAGARGLVERLSVVKEKSELELIEKAAEITDAAFTHILSYAKPGVREVELAAELEYFMKTNGSEKPAFETIIASGARSALPHGLASSKRIAAGDFITFDYGATYRGYVADMTRTIVVGKASARQKKIYGIVLKAQKAALAKIKHGRKASDVDLAARNIITKAGYGKNFGHGTGHGIGFYVHVPPRVAHTSHDVLASGMVITVEPGIYIPQWGGVRIEDDVVVTKSGGRILNKSPKNLLEV